MPWTTSSEQQAPFRWSYLRWLHFTPTLQYILENFSHAPSRDLEPATLHMLVQLMCGQVVCLSALRLLRPQSPFRRASVSMRKQRWLVEKRSWC